MGFRSPLRNQTINTYIYFFCSIFSLVQIQIFLQFFYKAMGAVAQPQKQVQCLPSGRVSKDQSRPLCNQNIQNEEPYANLSNRISKQFKESIVASKNLLIQQIKNVKQKSQIKDLPGVFLQNNQQNPFNSQLIFDILLKPVVQAFTRIKPKRPNFEMIQIDPTKFLKAKHRQIQLDYDFLQQIGKGGYGSVFKAKEKRTKEIRAIKKIPKTSLTSLQKMQLANEFQILCMLDHPNIIKLYDIYEDKSNLFVVTQLCQGGDLLKFVNKTKLTDKAMRSVMIQLLSAVKYMHSFKILHRDIKLENIVLVKDVTGQNQKIEIKLIDFGISVNLNNVQDSEEIEPLGTLLYMSPQSLNNQLVLESDMWSCGIALYLMATRKIPYVFQSESDLLKKVKKGQINRNSMQKLPLELKVYIMQFLEINASIRCSPTKALNNSWLKRDTIKGSLTNSARVSAAKNLLHYNTKNNLVSMIEAFLIYKKVNQDQRQRLALIFQQIDEDKSGIIEIDELKKFYSDNSEHYDAKEVEQLLATMDKNKSGKIDFNEFITAMCDRRRLFQNQALQQAFDFVDKDRSGAISRAELEEMLEGVQHQQIQQLFSELDKNNDEKISKGEFMTYLSRCS